MSETVEKSDDSSTDSSESKRPKLLPPQGILSFDDSDSAQNPLDGFVIGVYLDIAANGDSDEVRLRAAEALGRGRGHDAKAEAKAGKFRGQGQLPAGYQQNNFVFAQETTLRQLMSGIKSLGLVSPADNTMDLPRGISAEGD